MLSQNFSGADRVTKLQDTLLYRHFTSRNLEAEPFLNSWTGKRDPVMCMCQKELVKVARKVDKCCLAKMIEELPDGCICVELMF